MDNRLSAAAALEHSEDRIRHVVDQTERSPLKEFPGASRIVGRIGEEGIARGLDDRTLAKPMGVQSPTAVTARSRSARGLSDER